MVQFSLHFMIRDEELQLFSTGLVEEMDQLTKFEEDLRYIVDEGLLYGPVIQEGTGSVVRLVTTHAGLYVSKELKPTSREALVFGHGFSPDEVLRYERGLTQLTYDPNEADTERIATNMRLHQAFMRSQLGRKTVLPAATYTIDQTVFRVQPYFPTHSPLYTQEYAFVSRQREIFYSALREQWVKAQMTQDFARLPRDLQGYLKTYGIDPGCGDNAGFVGVTNTPQFRLLDY